MKLSVVISAYNEGDRIGSCLESVSWADEIVVIDNASTDDTADVARTHGARVFTRPNHPMLNINKNYGFSKAKGAWILNLDADERVTEELQDEISKLFDGRTRSDADQIVAYKIPRKNIIFGKWIEHAGWWPDYQLRLFKKGKASFDEEHIHEQMSVKGEVRTLDHPIEHDNYQTISQFVSKLNHYTDNESQQIIKKGYTFSGLDAIRYPKEEFFRRYFAQDGYKDGFHGLMLSMAMAMYHFVIFLKLWEHNKFPMPNLSANELTQEWIKSYREGLHWCAQTGKTHLSVIRKLLIKLGV